jgi:hypothetical protein
MNNLGPNDSVQSVSTILMPDQVETTALQAQLHEAELQLAYFKAQLKDAREFPRQLQDVLYRLVWDATDQGLPEDADINAMYSRLVELIEADNESNIWYPKREYGLTMTYIVTITGRVTARSEQEAILLARDYEPQLVLETSGNLTDADISTSLDEVHAEED